MRFLVPFTFSIVSALLALALAEGTVRLTGAWVEKDYDHRDHFRDPGIPGVPYMLKPNLNLVWSERKLVTNSLGLADPHEPGAATSCRRILILGSSTTQGFGVDFEDAYPRVLERELNAAGSGCYEVINAGQDAYTVREKAALLKYLMPLYRPQLIIVDLNPYDYDDSISVNSAGFLWEPPQSVSKHDWLGVFWEPKIDPLEPYLGYSHAYRFFRPHFLNLFGREKERRRSAIFVSPFYRNRFVQGIRAIEAQAQQIGAPLVFFSMDVPLAPQSFAESSRLVDAATIVGEAYPRFLERYGLVWDPHPNRRGHTVLARGLHRYLSRTQLVSSQVPMTTPEYEPVKERAELGELIADATKNFASEIHFQTRRNLHQLVGGLGADLYYDGYRSGVYVVLNAKDEDTVVVRGEALSPNPEAMFLRVSQNGSEQIFTFTTKAGPFEIIIPMKKPAHGLVDVAIGCERTGCGASSIFYLGFLKR